MSKFNFDKKVFNRGYAFIYTLLQYVFVLGFIFAVCIVILSSTTGMSTTIPDSILPLAVGYLIASLIGFPLITVIKMGYKRLVAGSTVTYDGETLIYDKLADKLWTVVGHVEEHHLYTVYRIESVTPTKFSYVVKGDIEKVVINNGRKLNSKNVGIVKIPNAYASMERVIKHG